MTLSPMVAEWVAAYEQEHGHKPADLVLQIAEHILKVGKMFDVGYEKIMLLYTPLTYERADVINTYVYRRGMENAQWSYSAAVGFFNSVVCFLLVFVTNTITRRSGGNSLW